MVFFLEGGRVRLAVCAFLRWPHQMLPWMVTSWLCGQVIPREDPPGVDVATR